MARSVVRRRLRVMFTITTLDDKATASPISAAATGERPAARPTSSPTSVVSSTWAGASHINARCSRRSRRMSISMPTSKSSRMTPMSASSSSCSRWATKPGVKGETTAPTAR